jgi:hypothetical protein
MADFVRDVMTPGVVAVRPDASLVEAAQLMRAQDIGDVVVADGQDVVGVLTDRDITVGEHAYEVLAVADRKGSDVETPHFLGGLFDKRAWADHLDIARHHVLELHLLASFLPGARQACSLRATPNCPGGHYAGDWVGAIWSVVVRDKIVLVPVDLLGAGARGSPVRSAASRRRMVGDMRVPQGDPRRRCRSQHR